MKKVILASSLLLAFSSVQAAESPRWDMASLSYQSVDIDGDKLTGFGISGSKLLNDDFFAIASYGSVSDEISDIDFDYDSLSAGLGYRYAISKSADVFGVLSYEKVKLKASYRGNSESDSENGYGLQVGVRSMITEQFELVGSVQYIDIADDSDTAFSVGALYDFTEQFSAGVSYTKGDDIDTIALSAVYFF